MANNEQRVLRTDVGDETASVSSTVSAELNVLSTTVDRSTQSYATHVEPRGRALVVVDDADMRHYVCDCLSEEFDVIGAADSARAIGIVGWMLPDIIVCDLVLCDMGGVDLRTALAADPLFACTPFVFIGDQPDMPDARHILVQPFSRSTLLAAVRHALDL